MVVWLVHGVHGNEISSSDAALLEAYHLLAAQGDAGVDAVLHDALVLIDPMQNPDGRARFVFQNLQGRAATPDPTPYNAEHDEPWPGGRSNHYLFDMNRDWFAQTQPETRGRMQVALDYFPQVDVDLHEMGGDNTYYFAPPADPLNPHITKSQIAGFDLFGRANAAAVRRARLAVLHPRGLRRLLSGLRRHVADVPRLDRHDLRAGVGARPVVRAQRRHGAHLSATACMHHFNAAITTAITAAQQSRAAGARLPRVSAAARWPKARRARCASTCWCPATTRRAPRCWRATSPPRASRCGAPTEPVTVGGRAAAGRRLPGVARAAGGPPGAQPAGPRHPSRTDDFIKRRKSAAQRRQPDQIYDITAWSLPLMYDVEVVTSADGDRREASPVPSAYDAPPPARTVAAGKVGYLVPWGSAAAALTVEALAQGIRIHSVGGAFTLDGRAIRSARRSSARPGNPADLHARLTALATRHGAEVVPIDTTYVDAGHLARQQPARRSEGAARAAGVGHADADVVGRLDALRARAPLRPGGDGRALVVARRGRTSPTSTCGAAVRQLRRRDQRRGAARLKDWIRAGGTLDHAGRGHALGDGASDVGLLDTNAAAEGRQARRPATPRRRHAVERRAAAAPSRLTGATGGASPRRARRQRSPRAGAAAEPAEARSAARRRPAEVSTTTRPSSPIASVPTRSPARCCGPHGHGALAERRPGRRGAGDHRRPRVFAPIKLNSGRNVVNYATKERLVASGLIWPEGQDLLVRKAFLMHQPIGQGHVIAFAEDANYRAYSEAHDAAVHERRAAGAGLLRRTGTSS